MPPIQSADQPSEQTKDENGSPSKEVQSGTTLALSQSASVVAIETGAALPGEQKQPDKLAESDASPAATPPQSQPRPRAGTGLKGFWIKVAVSAFVILVGLISIFSLFSENEPTSMADARQVGTNDQGVDESASDSVISDTETTVEIIYPPPREPLHVVDPESLGKASNESEAFTGNPVTETAVEIIYPPPRELLHVVDPESLGKASNESDAFGGNPVTNAAVVETAATAGLSQGITPVTAQPLANSWDTAASIPDSGRFYAETAKYRPELFRPLEPEQQPLPPTRPSVVTERSRAFSVPTPSYYPAPGAYGYPPAPPYGSYDRYYPY